MKVSGFTYVRNAIKFDYMVIESIHLIMPNCDEIIVAVGNSDDETLDFFKKNDSLKIKIIETIWDITLSDSDWAIYVKANKVFLKKELPKIQTGMENLLSDTMVVGLLFRYVNYSGDFDYKADLHKMWHHNKWMEKKSKRLTSSITQTLITRFAVRENRQKCWKNEANG